MTTLKIRPATEQDIDRMTHFIFHHGPNDWNYLPEPEVKAHLNDIANGNVYAFIAEVDHQCVGFASAILKLPQHLLKYQTNPDAQCAYLSEIVVHRDETHKGIGSQLIQTLITFLRGKQIDVLYTERHEQNPGSSGVMHKNHFQVIDVFDDPKRRPLGSGKTAVLKVILNAKSI